MQVKSNQNMFEPVHMPASLIQRLRSLFTTYRLYRKHITGIKNRIHSLCKQEFMPFTKAYIFGKKSKTFLRQLNINPQTDFQLDLLFTELETFEASIQKLTRYIMYPAKPYISQIDILTSMKGISVITAIALIADISDLLTISGIPM